MKKFLLLSFMLVATLLSTVAVAQDRTITGTVTAEEDGSALPGVNVLLKGTSTGTVTDINGSYRLSVPSEGGTLVFTFVGLKTQEVAIGNQSTIDVGMASDVTQLGEVVVTALNIERDKKTLGYATQQVEQENLRVAREQNLNEALAGKIAGVQVVSGSGAKFGQSAIRIRGVRGLSSSDPLYVVDGIVVADPASINMDNVQSINVLKGANAAALYGSRARDGVIIIKSKTASEGAVQVNFNNTTTFENVALLPKYQNQYGGGYSLDFNTFNFDPTTDDPALAGLDGASTPEFYSDESWGPLMDGRMVAHWDAFIPGTEGYGQMRPWVSNEDNVNDFFEQGVFVNNSLNIGKAGENYNINATLSVSDRGGVLPNSDQNRTFLNLNTRVDLSEKLTMNAMANYSRTSTIGNLSEGYGSIGSNFNQWFQRQLDMDLLEKYWRMPDGRYTSWNMNSARNPTPLYWNNPYTEMYANFSESNEEVISARFGLSYEIIEGLTLNANLNRYFKQYYSESRTASGTLEQDYFGTSTYDRMEDNYEFIATYNKTWESFSLEALAGGNIRRNKGKNWSMGTSGGLSVPDLYNISASIDRPSTSNYFFERHVNSVFAEANIGYKGIVYLRGSFRRDWDSALPESSNAFTYPAISTSVVFSELLNSQDILSFGKVRFSYAEVGGELGAYSLDPVYSLGTPYSGNPTMAVPNSITDPNLIAATTAAYEAGFELAFLENRIRADFSYYYYDNSDEIIDVSVDPTTGYGGLTINSGKMFTKGWDATIGGTPVRSGAFTWDVNFNFARSTNEIESLYPGLESIILGNGNGGTSTWGGWGGITARAQVDEEWGTIIGRKFQRDESGNLVVDGDGYPLWEENQNLGSILPDYTGGIFNRFTFKNFEFSFTIDWQIGGKFHSFTEMFNAYSGLGDETVGTNSLGNDMRLDPGEGGGLTFGGVYEDGTPNDTFLSAQAYWKGLFGLHEQWVFDATYVKLREVRLGYNIPESVLSRVSFLNRASIAIVSNNTWLIHSEVPGIDPSQISGDTRDARNNGSWVDGGQLPPTRTIGVDIRLGF